MWGGKNVERHRALKSLERSVGHFTKTIIREILK